MQAKTHICAALSAGLLVSANLDLNLPQILVATTCCAVGSIIPDVDNASSTVGRRLPIASFMVQHIIGHRTMFHSPLFYMALWFVVRDQFPIIPFEIQTLFFVGIATHLILDFLNPLGIPLLWPCSKKFHIGKIQSCGIFDDMLWVLFSFLAAAIAIQTFLPYLPVPSAS